MSLCSLTPYFHKWILLLKLKLISTRTFTFLKIFFKQYICFVYKLISLFHIWLFFTHQNIFSVKLSDIYCCYKQFWLEPKQYKTIVWAVWGGSIWQLNYSNNICMASMKKKKNGVFGPFPGRSKKREGGRFLVGNFICQSQYLRWTSLYSKHAEWLGNGVGQRQGVAGVRGMLWTRTYKK